MQHVAHPIVEMKFEARVLAERDQHNGAHARAQLARDVLVWIRGSRKRRGDSPAKARYTAATLFFGSSTVQITRETTAAHLIRAYEPGRVRVGERWLSGNVIVTADRLIENWTTSEPAALTIAELEHALALDPEIVLLGTGDALLLPDVDLMALLAKRGIGLEIMGTAAACRTFNVLVHEHRRVVAALFNPPAPG